MPVRCVTPACGHYMHTFYDVSPWSPSGRYLVCLRLPFCDREPGPEDEAEVCLIDLWEERLEPLYRTTGWGLQTAAHQVWGRTDRYLYFNDKRGGRPVGVRFDLHTREAVILDGPVYQVTPDETYALSPSLVGINRTQGGYGVSLSPELDKPNPPGPSERDGLWQVDLRTGKKSLLLSFAQIFDVLEHREELEGGSFYGFHVKINPQQTRVLFVVRVLTPGERMKSMAITCAMDGTDVRVAVPHRRWARGGHHPNWHPDGERIVINLAADDGSLRFHEVRYDGSGERVLVPHILGSGHPTYSRNGRYLVTDAYPREPVARDAWVPLRLIDLEHGVERTLTWMWVGGNVRGVLRLDMHPAWNRAFDQLCLAGAPDEYRQLFIADLAPLGVEFA